MGYFVFLCFFFFGAFLSTLVQADIICGTGDFIVTCYGYGAYCCGDECCVYGVYSFWWFWFIWFWVILLIVSCSIWICRRRRRMAMPRYVVVEPQQTYGTVHTHTAYSNVPPAGPPSAPAYQQKPPPYSAQ